MALKKEIKDDRGIITNYHKISIIELDNDLKKMKITLKSYVDETYRDIEKQYQAKEIELSNIMEQINEENRKDSPDTELVIQLSNQYNNLVFQDASSESKSILSRIVELDYNESITIGEVYQQLKTLEPFKGSEDV